MYKFKTDMLKKIATNVEIFTGRTTDLAFKRITLSAHDGFLWIYGYDGYAYMWLKFPTETEFPTVHMSLNEFIAATQNSQDISTDIDIKEEKVVFSSGSIISSVSAEIENEIYGLMPSSNIIGEIGSKDLQRIMDIGSMCADRTGTEENLIMFRLFKDYFGINGVFGNMNSFACHKSKTYGNLFYFIPYNTIRHMVKVLGNAKDIELKISDDEDILSIFSENFGFSMPGTKNQELEKLHNALIGKSKEAAIKGKTVELEKENLHDSLDAALKIARITGGTFSIEVENDVTIKAKTNNGSSTKIDVCKSNIHGGNFFVNIEMLRSFVKRIEADKYAVKYHNDSIVVMDGTINEMLLIMR